MARIVIPDVPHHVTQRGNRREDVFFEDADHRRYLLLMLDYSRAHALEIWAYWLMTNGGARGASAGSAGGRGPGAARRGGGLVGVAATGRG